MKTNILVLLCCTLSLTHCDIPLGILSPNKDKYEEYIYNKTVQLATEENAPPDVKVTYRVETTMCDAILTSGKTSDLIYTYNVSAVFGPRCGSCNAAIQGTTYSNKLLISHNCIEVTSSAAFPYFIRTRPFAREHSTQIANIYSIMARKFDWQRLGIVFSTVSGWSTAKNGVETELRKKDLNVVTFAVEAYNSLELILSDVKKRARIVLFLCSETTTIDILVAAYTAGFYDAHQYAFITIDLDLLVLEEKNLGQTEAEILNGIINIKARSPKDVPTTKYTSFLNKMNESFFDEFDTYNPYTEIGHMEHVYESASYLYDAVLVYLQSVKDALDDHMPVPVTPSTIATINTTDPWNTTAPTANTTEAVNSPQSSINTTNSANTTTVLSANMVNATMPSNVSMTTNAKNETASTTHTPNYRAHRDVVYNTTLIKRYIKSGTFDGLTGKIDIKELGTRDPDLMIINLLRNGTQLLFHGTWTNAEIVWLGGSENVPADEPQCGFSNICPSDNSTWIIVAIVAPVALLLLFIIYKLIKLQRYENDINNKESIKSFADVKINPLLQGKLSQEQAINKHGTLNEVSGNIRMRVYYNGKKTMLKKLPKKAVLMTREIMTDLKVLRDLNHENINKYIGVISKSPVICILQEWCKKGSLYDILNNEDIQLDWVFKNTFISDILNGMVAIHDSPLKLHGHLTSKNCLINHRWVVQISDYGMREFKKIKNQKDVPVPNDEQLKYENLLWTSPENINFPHNLMTRQGDVYSFGIIISEIINRQPPYAAFDDMRPSDIIHYVNKRCIPPFRPHVTLQTGLDPRLVDLMKTCWEEWPEDRPLFKELKPQMKTIRGESVDILDNMIEMMERYSRDLDKTAKERTEMYKKEKIKSNQLLYRCIPKPIVTELLEGNLIEPDNINPATIMIVKIEGFSSLMKWLKPQQIIDVLNDFHRMIEQVTEPVKNVFKSLVDREECIFCGNIPCYKERSSPHLMANLALKIAKARPRFRWRHLGEEVLRLKITLHSGPATGVMVGNKIPVYNILGTTMDYVRALTHYTPHDKIVVSNDCYELLKDDEDFIWQSIGEVQSEDIELTEPQYLIGSKVIGMVFPEDPTVVVDEEEEVEEMEEKEEFVDIKPLVKEKPPYMDVSAVVQTAFKQWFEKKEMNAVPMRALNKEADI
ncbi:atrial natriuretic peptide receptor 1-like isoform X1 [Hydractinia symbiolongicarpus]|uniref:atrial natriuretic peptide receptor 1-like isoform X1 n=1 Tax=Hydractinia symbiolongicarpus TaxID=13093 RepID=UPI00254C1A90|nr:atrial natriuretic peptide receptor 1-like isoform X1 [Hydractinia symbiolongicarpus]